MAALMIALLLAQNGAAPAAAPAAQEPSRDPERIICRNEPVTGSRLRYTRICLTPQQWEARRAALTRRVREHSDRASLPQGALGPGQ